MQHILESPIFLKDHRNKQTSESRLKKGEEEPAGEMKEDESRMAVEESRIKVEESKVSRPHESQASRVYESLVNKGDGSS